MAGALELLISSPSEDVRCTEMMSARGTMTSSDPAPAQRQDVGEHRALLRREAASRRARASLRSTRLQIGARRDFQPNIARSTRASQLSPLARGAACGDRTGRFTRSGAKPA
jgi:hypothetical protein